MNNRTVNTLEDCHVEVEVEVDTETWKEALKKAFTKLAQDVEIKGFRKGKAPENLVREKIDPAKQMNEAISSLLQPLYTEVLTEEKIVPYAQPGVEVTKCSDTDLTVKFTITTAPHVELSEYKGLEIGKEEAAISEEEVDKAVNETLKENATLVPKEGSAALGDTVVIDFVGEVDGEEFEGGSASNYELELGSNSFIPGFEDQLVGVTPESSIDVNVTFPENYVEELKGKPAVFHVTVHEVKEKSLPALDDKFVESLELENIKTVMQLRDSKRSDLLKEKTQQLHDAYLNTLIDTIAEKATKIEIPHEIIESQVEAQREDTENQMAQSGITLEQYLQIVGQSEEDFMAQIEESATRSVRNYFILDKVGQLEEITIEDADLEFEYARMAEAYHMSIDDVRKALSSQLGQFRDSVRFSRIEDFLYRNNN
ncbi:MAG: trigger factor [Coprobacillus sp.]|nr:trigger factor [Coprobacillus sp.]